MLYTKGKPFTGRKTLVFGHMYIQNKSLTDLSRYTVPIIISIRSLESAINITFIGEYLDLIFTDLNVYSFGDIALHFQI